MPFLRFAALAGFGSAVTTLLMWGLPKLGPATAGPRWTANFVHIFLSLTAYLGAAFVLARRSMEWAALGYVCFVLWGFTELLGVSVFLWVRPVPAGFQPIWDAMFFLLLMGFLLGTTIFGAVAAAGTGVERTVGMLMLAACPLTICITLSEYYGVRLAGTISDAVYPFLQPVSRSFMGWWLWKSHAGATNVAQRRSMTAG